MAFMKIFLDFNEFLQFFYIEISVFIQESSLEVYFILSTPKIQFSVQDYHFLSLKNRIHFEKDALVSIYASPSKFI